MEDLALAGEGLLVTNVILELEAAMGQTEGTVPNTLEGRGLESTWTFSP